MRPRHLAPLAALAVLCATARDAGAQPSLPTHPGTTALIAQISATPPMSDAEFVRRHVAAAGFAWVPENTRVTQLGLLRRQTGRARGLRRADRPALARLVGAP